MSMAKPILTTKITDIPEALGECGYLVDPSKPSQLADGIRYILHRRDEAKSKGYAARNRCVQNYNMYNLEYGLRALVEKVVINKT